MTDGLREKCPYSEFFCSVFSRIWTEYGEIRSISPYSVRMRKNADQKNCEYGHLSRSDRDGSIKEVIEKKNVSTIGPQVCVSPAA